MSEILNCYISGETYRIIVKDILEIARVLSNKGFLKIFIEDIKKETDFLEAMEELLERGLIESDASLEDHKKWIEGNKKLIITLENLSSAPILLGRGI